MRLSKDVLPKKYIIKLHPDLENFTFAGEETIIITLLKDQNSITLHSKDIDITTARLDKVFSKKIVYDENAETATFHFPTKIKKGSHKLVLSFQGILKNNLRGFYRSSYIFNGKVHNIATTQFEATDARRAFPCFDEPAQKAVFEVSLVVEKGKSAISNTLAISKMEHESGFEVIKFAPSPKMSTYLLAFIVGDFEYIEKKSKRGVVARVYTPKGKVHQAQFALDVTVKVLDFYEKYFDIPYPLPNLDSIAIPDFSSGAMENWGAITYRESMLLVDPEHTSSISKQWIALVIAHELAHQWFGNLVTMEWWTHLWLNEGFASYIEYLAIDKIMPELKVWEQFMTTEHGVALKLDSLLNTHPIEVEVHHPDEIGEIFDEISYSKGASIIRMLANYLGEEDFRDGLRHYLKKHSYKNTSTVHLWEAFEKVSKKPVRKMMHTWTSKSGYPIVSVAEKNNKLVLEQERFFQSALSKSKSKDKSIWPIPVSILHKNKQENFLLTAKRINKQIINSAWLKLNTDESGFYRTHYNKNLLEVLKEPIAKKELSVLDRLGIIRDLFTLPEAGIGSSVDTLKFLPTYKDEKEFIILSEIASGLNKFENTFANKIITPKLNALTISLFKDLYDFYGWNKKLNETHTDILLRALVLARLGKAGFPAVVREARKKFNNLSKNNLDPDIRSAIYGIVATHGGIKEFKTLLSMYRKESLHQEKNRIGYALGDFKDVKILEKVCEFAMSSDVRSQDAIGILTFVASNPIGRDIWLRFTMKNWDTMIARYGDGGYALSRYLKSFSSANTKKQLELFRKFFKSHPTPAADRAVDQVIERIENNILWQKRDKKTLEKYLKSL